jgi:hypothetical protein
MLDTTSLEQQLRDKEGEIARLRASLRLLAHQLDGAELLLERYRHAAQEDRIAAPWMIIVCMAIVTLAAGFSAWLLWG